MSVEKITEPQSNKANDTTSCEQKTRQDIKGKIIQIIPQNQSSSFRRVMFPSKLDPKKTSILDTLCLDFIRQTRCFDEIIIVEYKDEILNPIYDFSLRGKDEESITLDDFKDIVNIGKNLNLGDWRYVSSAEGSSFDMVGKITHSLLLCVNNTGLSIEELEEKYSFWIFEEVKPVIERSISQMKQILKTDI